MKTIRCNILLFYVLLASIFVTSNKSLAQLSGCANIDVGSDLNFECIDSCVTLEAEVVEVGLTTQYEVTSIPPNPPYPYDQGTTIFVGQDDTFSDVVPLPFDFCFFENNYNEIIVGANGVLSFDVGLAGGNCAWQFDQSMPNSNGVPYQNSINGAYHDIDPSVGGEIRYAILGEHPCRTFIVSYFNVPHYQCNNIYTTQQIVLYETTNIIDVYIADKPTCNSWNNGNAVLGIQNAQGTVGYIPPARNTGPWSASDEAWRFSPSGASVYTINWYDEAGTNIGTGNSIEVCPTETTNYSADVVYDICDGTQVIESDDITVNFQGSTTTSLTVVETCDPYFWNNVNYNSTGIYTYTTTNSQGCDSVATLDLTVHLATYSINTAVSCDPFFWNGSFYDQTGIYQFTMPGSTGCDSVSTLELTIIEPTTSLTIIEECNEYSWNGTTYTSSGTYTYYTANAVGCDSIATLDLTINTPSFSNFLINSCEPYDWNGITYTSSGQYTYQTINSNGCDSIATLDLIINAPSQSFSTVVSCAPYSWNNVDYDQTGTYSYTTLNSVGCDSIAILNLTVNSPSSSSFSVVSCEPYSWNGTTYSQSGTYTHSETNAVGCDSTSTLNLVVNHPSSSLTTIATCISFDWNGNTYFDSGTYTYVTMNSAGCDSTATLDLTIQDFSASYQAVSACNQYLWNGTMYSLSGVYTYNTFNYKGCDSIATLDLTINYPTSSYNTIMSCEAVDWNGTTYSNSGNYTYFTNNSNGCDSIAYLDLVIGYPTTSLEITDACGEYFWNGLNYTETGVYSFTSTNWMGCDSIATLDLVVNEIISTNNYVEREACNEFIWNETTYTESGEYSYTTENVYGCDSTTTLLLTIYSDRLYVPNSFTPDNDGVNDVFTPIGKDVELKSFQVYNRWGDEVFYTDTLDAYGSVWNGTLNGSDYLCPDGVYSWRAIYKCLSHTHEKYGHVNLFR